MRSLEDAALYCRFQWSPRGVESRDDQLETRPLIRSASLMLLFWLSHCSCVMQMRFFKRDPDARSERQTIFGFSGFASLTADGGVAAVSGAAASRARDSAKVSINCLQGRETPVIAAAAFCQER